MEILKSISRVFKLGVKLSVMCLFIFPQIFSKKELEEANIYMRSQS
jgi:hypothetical protein